MARIKGQLKHGVKVGKDLLKEFELHSNLTAGQIIAAKEASEKVVPFDEGGRIVPMVVESPARLGGLMLCQQIASLGYLAGPLDFSLFEKLHEEDLFILNTYADLAAGALSAAQVEEKLAQRARQAVPEVSQRGRGVSSGTDAGADRIQAAEEGGQSDRHPGDAERATTTAYQDDRC